MSDRQRPVAAGLERVGEVGERGDEPVTDGQRVDPARDEASRLLGDRSLAQHLHQVEAVRRRQPPQPGGGQGVAAGRGDQLGGVGPGLDQGVALQRLDRAVDGAARPARERGQLQPVEQGQLAEPAQEFDMGLFARHQRSPSSERRARPLFAVRGVVRLGGSKVGFSCVAVDLLQALPVLGQLALLRRLLRLEPVRGGLVGRGLLADPGGRLGIAELRFSDPHREGGGALRTDRGPHVAVMHGLGDDVLLRDPVAAQLPDQLSRVRAGDLEDAETADVGQQRVAHRGRELVQLGQALGGQHERGAVLAQLGERLLEVDPGDGLHLVDHDQRAAALRLGQPLLLANRRIDQVEQRGPDQSGDVAADRALGGRDEQNAAFEDGPPEVDRGARLTQDRAGALGRGVVVEPGLHRGQRIGLVLAPPAAEVTRPPLGQVRVAQLVDHAGAELLVREQAERIEDRVLLPRPRSRDADSPRAGS